jgi:ribosomal protein S18 acetylase RimI-like enzyme
VPVSIDLAAEASDDLVAAIARLLPQLSSSAPPDAAVLSEIIADPDCALFVARLDGAIVGCLTLVTFRTPSAKKAWIEDVIVDDDVRGQGIGDALNRAAIALAAERGADKVDLTSRPKREAANRLYRRLGFVERDTHVYRLKL